MSSMAERWQRWSICSLNTFSWIPWLFFNRNLNFFPFCKAVELLVLLPIRGKCLILRDSRLQPDSYHLFDWNGTRLDSRLLPKLKLCLARTAASCSFLFLRLDDVPIVNHEIFVCFRSACVSGLSGWRVEACIHVHEDAHDLTWKVNKNINLLCVKSYSWWPHIRAQAAAASATRTCPGLAT